MSKKRSIQGKSNHGAILRQPCRYYLKGTCTRSPCEYWHPPECQFYKTEAGWPGEWGPQGMSRTTCMCANTFFLLGWHVKGEKGRINVLPWYRLVGVAKTSSETQRRKNRAARERKWSPRGTGNRQAPPILEVRPGNRQGW